MIITFLRILGYLLLALNFGMLILSILSTMLIFIVIYIVCLMCNLIGILFLEIYTTEKQ
jgi:hypothetical protein